MNPPANHINKYLPAAILYFFLNGFLLPVGLLYTTLLTPLLLIWVARYRYIRPMLLYFLLLVPFIVAHGFLGVDWTFYGYSVALSFTVFVFGLAFYQYVFFCHSLREIFQSILLINALLTVIALIALAVPGLREFFWYNKALSRGIEGIERLKMLTYEPSYYSFMLAPIAIYYLLKAIRNELPQRATYLALVLIPLFLSLAASADHPGRGTVATIWRFAPGGRMGLAVPGCRCRGIPDLSRQRYYPAAGQYPGGQRQFVHGPHPGLIHPQPGHRPQKKSVLGHRFWSI